MPYAVWIVSRSKATTTTPLGQILNTASSGGGPPPFRSLPNVMRSRRLPMISLTWHASCGGRGPSSLLSSQMSSRRLPLKMLLTVIVSLLTYGWGLGGHHG